MPAHSGNDEADWGLVGTIFQQHRAALQVGGPPVDQVQLLDLVAGELAESEARDVRLLTQTWLAWHDEYWQLRAYLELSKADLAGGLTTAEERDAAHPPVFRTPTSNPVSRRVVTAPDAMALGDASETDGDCKIVTVLPEQCAWSPSQPTQLAQPEARIRIRLDPPGTLSVTVEGFLFESDEYQLEAVWFAANQTEIARAAPENPFVPTIWLMSSPPRDVAPDDELEIRTTYEPETGGGWFAAIRIPLG